jgi:hypothetical protein
MQDATTKLFKQIQAFKIIKFMGMLLSELINLKKRRLPMKRRINKRVIIKLSSEI